MLRDYFMGHSTGDKKKKKNIRTSRYFAKIYGAGWLVCKSSSRWQQLERGSRVPALTNGWKLPIIPERFRRRRRVDKAGARELLWNRAWTRAIAITHEPRDRKRVFCRASTFSPISRILRNRHPAAQMYIETHTRICSDACISYYFIHVLKSR